MIFNASIYTSIIFSSVQSLSHVQLFATPWTAAHQASLSITNSWSLLKLKSIELVMPANHLVLCHPILLLPSIFASIRIFSNEPAYITLFHPKTHTHTHTHTGMRTWSNLALNKGNVIFVRNRLLSI